MKTTVKKMDYEQVMALPRPEHCLPRKPNIFWRSLVRFLSWVTMLGTPCTYDTEGLKLTMTLFWVRKVTSLTFVP